MAKVIKRKRRGKTLYLDYRLSDGSRITRKAKIQNMRGAERELALKVAELEANPALSKTRKITFGKMCFEWFELYAKVNHRSSKSLKNDQSVLRALIAFFGSSTYLHTLTTRQIEGYIAYRLKSVSAGTVNRNLVTLKCMLNKTVDWNYLSVNPAQPVKHLPVDNKMTGIEFN